MPKVNLHVNIPDSTVPLLAVQSPSAGSPVAAQAARTQAAASPIFERRMHRGREVCVEVGQQLSPTPRNNNNYGVSHTVTVQTHFGPTQMNVYNHSPRIRISLDSNADRDEEDCCPNSCTLL